jgi:hypothetical protein
MVLKDEANAPTDLQQLHDLKYRTEGKSATSNGNNALLRGPGYLEYGTK